jgi:RNA-directed DNA polymerase
MHKYLGSPLSPIIGAFFLNELDEALEKRGLFYIRFMDDILVLAPTRWKLRKAVKIVNQVLASLCLEKHPDKTFIGRIVKGFDWLGYRISPAGLSIATKTLENFVARIRRLYEQSREEPDGSFRLGDYVRRWVRWVRGGVDAFSADSIPGNAVSLLHRVWTVLPVHWHSGINCASASIDAWHADA